MTIFRFHLWLTVGWAVLLLVGSAVLFSPTVFKVLVLMFASMQLATAIHMDRHYGRNRTGEGIDG